MPIPVFCLSGLKTQPYTRMEDWQFGGQLFRDPYVRRDVLYANNKPNIVNATDGADKAYAAAKKTKGQCILTGHSQGSQALEILLRDPGMDLDPDKVVFVLGGNPERKYGGITRIEGSGWPAVYGGNGFPDATPYRVWDVARQYEFWTDYPSDLKNKDAVENARDGFGLHLDYSGVRLGDPQNVEWKEGNVTYVLQPTFPMPKCRKWYWGADREALEDQKIRAKVEEAYTRPKAVPQQTIKRYSAKGGYDTANRQAITLSQGVVWNPFGSA